MILFQELPERLFIHLFIAFLYYFAKKSLIPCAIMIALLGMFYPQCVFLASGMLILQLFDWQGIRAESLSSVIAVNIILV